MAGRTATARPVAKGATGQPLSEAEKLALRAQQEAAFKVFARRFKGRLPKDRVQFLARVIEMSDSPFEHTDNFGPRMVSLVKVELVEPGLEGIRFVQYVTDNPKTQTIFNSDSALNHLVYAATGRTIPEHGKFDWDTDEVVGQLVWAVIRRGNDREDGLRGGMWSELKDYARYFPEEAEEEGEPTPGDALKKALAAMPRTSRENPTGGATRVVVMPEGDDPELDEVPF